MKPCSPIAAPRRGFTLIELLTVIAIIGILAAIIIPTVGKVRATAAKAACTSNLRQLVSASHLFAEDNKQQFPTRDTYKHWENWRHVHVYHQDDFILFRPYLAIANANREASTVLFDPGPIKEAVNAANSGYNGSGGLFIGYAYYNIRNLNASIFTDYDTTAKRVRRADQIPSRFPLWGCLSMVLTNGTVIGHSEPRTAGTSLSGQNVARADGSVLWVSGDKLTTFVSEGANAYQGPRP